MAGRHIIVNIKQIKGIGDIAYIKHGNWSVCIDSHGAHVLGLFFKEKNLLHYNSADMEHSGIPICMPNFGPLINDIFGYQGANFTITQHGFFRDFGYQLLNNSACYKQTKQANNRHGEPMAQNNLTKCSHINTTR